MNGTVFSSPRERCSPKRWLGAGLVLSLVASLGVFSASSASAQTGPVAQVWARKLPSGNVEFGLSVTSAGSRHNVSLGNRYLLYGASSTEVGTWYYSDWQVIGDDPYRTYARVQVKKLLSGNVEFGLQIGGLGFEPDSKNRVWVPRARYLTYQAASTNSVLYSSDFNIRSEAHDCLNGTVFSSPDINKILLAHDCAALLEARDILQGTSTAFSNWNASTPISSWTGIELDAVGERVEKLEYTTRLGSSGTRITGQIPPHLGVVNALTHLSLDRNDLTGSIPVELGNLIQLVFLSLDRNDLTGSIPVELGNLIHLNSLYLNNNNLTGSIPVELGNLTKLDHMYLDYNSLTGSIPTQLGNIQGSRSATTGFQSLWLSSNNLTGGIPTTLKNLVSLTQLGLDNNNLTGGIPTELGDITTLEELRLSNNDLTGSIPSSIGGITSLTDFHIASNNLSGSIPSQLGNLRHLQALTLYRIQGATDTPRADDNPGLSGCIPAALNRSSTTVKRGNLEFCPTS